MSPAILPRPAVGVGAIVFDPTGRVLLVRRGRPPKAGLWSVPGGRLEVGESLAECCRREVLEETGIEVEPGPIVAVADREAEGFRYVIVDFLATLRSQQSPEPLPATDASDARWVDLESLAAYPLVEGLRAVILTVRSALDAGVSAGLCEAELGRLYLPRFKPVL